jgi:EpsI family protein
MGIFDRHLIVLLGLAALTGLAVALPRSVNDSDKGTPALRGVAPAVEGWTATTSVPENMLPNDPRAREVARWTYSRGDREVFVALASYRSRNDPEWQPAIDQIAPARGAASVRHDRLAISLNGTPGRTTLFSVVSVRSPDRSLSVVYWYQVQEKIIAGEFRLRLALLLNALRFRSEEVWLIRIAAPTSEPLEEFLLGFHPQLVKMLSH